MKVTFWGVRGSIAAPGRSTVEYGGNTSCVEIQAGDNLFIMDCGTGVRELGRSLLAGGEPIKGTLLLSHSHWDHIQGFPFFGPLLVPGHSFTILGPQEQTERLNETLADQMRYRYFPISLDQLGADIRCQEVREESIQVGTAVVRTRYLNHTSMAMAYRIEHAGRSVVYATDTEPFSQQPRAWEADGSRAFLHRGDERLADFFHGCDVLIIDSQYTAHEYPGRVGWGHGTPDYALDLAISAGVGTLVLFHHDPTRIDTAMSVVEELAKQRARQEAPDMEVIAAAEGLTLRLDDAPADAAPVPERQLPEFHARVRIAIVGELEDFVGMAVKTLGQEHYDLLTVHGLSSPAERQRVLEFEPHLTLLECQEAWDAGSSELLERQIKRRSPVLAIVPPGRFELAQSAFERGVEDVLIEPFAPTQLRSRIDSWLMRSGIAVDRRLRGRSANASETQALRGR